MGSHHVVVALVLALVTGVDTDFLGYEIRSNTAASDGYTSIILDGLPLALEVVTGFYVNMAVANCPIKVQIWRRIAYLKYSILCERDFTSTRTGPILIPLDESEEFIITSGDKLGFSSLRPDTTCVAYIEVTNPGNQSSTLRYSYNSGVPPVLGQTYSFDSYKNTYLFGVGIRVKYGLSQSHDFVLAGDEKILGYNVTTSSKVAEMGRATILLEGLRLTEGKVTGYYVHLPTPNCPIKLQIWRPTSGRQYQLMGETDFSSTTAGYFHVPTTSPLSVSVSDKLGFTSLHETSSCVPYLFVSDERRSQTLFSGFTDNSPPSVHSVHGFTALQTTFLFAVEVAIEEVVLLLPGPTGVDGQTGPQGPVGVKGVAGETGELGDKGLTGDQGPQGDDGTTGTGGFTGPVGITGPRGAAGPQGMQGSTGGEGQTGPVGADGDKGPEGDTGSQGEKGPVGDKGVLGATGAPGPSGNSTDGDEGSEGPAGPVGHTGPQGMTGETGIQGTVGQTGAKGPDGKTGSPGPMWTHRDHCKSANVSCEHDCESDGIQAVCSCRKGYNLVDKYRCLDTNECDTKNGLCQYECVNTEGSFHCACPPGLVLSKDMHRCNDIDECRMIPAPCSTDQICINLWGEFYCAGPWEEVEESLAVSVTNAVIGVPLVTRHVMIGLVLWLVLLSLLLLMAIILLVPELVENHRNPYKDSFALRGPRAEFYYPAFFPRISLDRRPSADKIDMVDSTTPRRMSRDEANAVQEEMYSHVNRGANLTETERKRSDL